jgi:hypothetical protein
MGCLVVLLGGFFPRFALFLVWIFTDRVERAFDDFLVPLLGVLFLPLTTLVYALVYTPGPGVDGFEWLLVGMAFLVDVSSYFGARRGFR